MNSTKSKPVGLLLIHKFSLLCVYTSSCHRTEKQTHCLLGYLRFLSFGSAAHANGPSEVACGCCCPTCGFRYRCRLRRTGYYSTGTADSPSSAAARCTALMQWTRTSTSSFTREHDGHLNAERAPVATTAAKSTLNKTVRCSCSALMLSSIALAGSGAPSTLSNERLRFSERQLVDVKSTDTVIAIKGK